jgi:hypothetical protein
MAYRCDHGWYPREIRTRKAACERQGRGAHHERRDHQEVFAVYQEMPEFLPDALATDHSSTAYGIECHF